MKRALLVTWVNYDNYGTLLQAYCLKKVLENLAEFTGEKNAERMSVEVLNYLKQPNDYGEKLAKIKTRSLQENMAKAIREVANSVQRWTWREAINTQKRQFDDFREEELNLCPKKILCHKSELEALPEFDIYVAGSDQIWNPALLDEVFLLGWVPRGKERIAYAPSVCVEKIAKEDLERYKVLKGYKALSVREYTGAVRQISELTDRKIEEVADPVILFGREKLRKLCHDSEGQDYCLTYLLGDEKEMRDYSIGFAQKNGLVLKSLIVGAGNNRADQRLMRQVIWKAGPLEFVDLIYNAKVVITNSFHAMIVAVLLHKDFILLGREEGGSEQNNRLKRFLEKVGMEDKLGERPQIIKKIGAVNWKEIDYRIENMRKGSLEYLNNAL